MIKQSTELCRKYTGPHSVLQIFLEKIINCIGTISLQIKSMAKNDLHLWREFKTALRRPAAPLQRSSSVDSGLLITTTSSQDKGQEIKGRNVIRPSQIED